MRMLNCKKKSRKVRKVEIRNSYFAYIIYLMLSILNMLIMHYYVLADKSELTPFSYVYNFIYTSIEVSLGYLILSVLRKKFFLIIPLILTFLFAICNILYCRYFGTYMPFSLYLEFNNLNGLSNNIVEALTFYDVLIILPLLVGLFLYKYIRNSFSYKCSVLFYFSCILIMFMFMCFSYVIEWHGDIYAIRYKIERRWTEYRYTDPTKSIFELGFMNSFLCDVLDFDSNELMKNEDKLKLEKYINNLPYSVPESKKNSNLIFILVESLLSIHSDLVINGKEVTPNLNALKREGYYNGKMIPEIELGESADGQFIYMTGMLPEKRGITAIDYVSNTFVSIVHLLKKENPIYMSRMIIPTASTFWRQNEWCVNYGIDLLLSKKDIKIERDRWLEDEDIFALAKQCDARTSEPFVSIILTSSTHTPYDDLLPSDIDWPDELPHKYQVYLSKLHYMDSCLGNYIKYIKSKEWYENSIVVIASDHHAHAKWFDMEDKLQDNYIPLYILNYPMSKIPKDIEICQSDLYPTLCDIFGIHSVWRGVGQSLLMPDSIKNSSYEMQRHCCKDSISLFLLQDDYFKDKFVVE